MMMDPALMIEQEYLPSQKAMNSVIDRFESPVQQFYCGAVVFVTGGSGFLGKQLVEKLFRACNIGKIYVLMRPKKGIPVQDRLNEIIKDSVYDIVRSKKPDFQDNIIAVEGDISEIRLGLSDQDWYTLTNEVDIIFHMAATTRFDEELRVATLINVRGTREALTLGKACKKLRSFVYVSTAYANAKSEKIGDEVFEKFYRTPVPPDAMIRMAETFDETKLNSLTEQLIQGYPNTYTFTKSIAEEEVRSYSGLMPICVIRPAVVISSYREPCPGWMDESNAYSASGVILAPATGLIHVLYADDHVKLSLVPVDFVNNVSIVAGYETNRRYQDGKKDIRIYSMSKLTSWYDVYSNVNEFGAKLPSPISVYYNFAWNTSNYYVFLLFTWLFHFIPGYILDGLCVLVKKPPMFMKIYMKVYKLSTLLSYFTMHTWYFNNDNTNKLYKSLTQNDKLIFNFDTTALDNKEFMTLWCLGIRKYLIKDSLKGTEGARRKQFWFQKLHCLILIVCSFCAWKFFCVTFRFLVYMISFVL